MGREKNNISKAIDLYLMRINRILFHQCPSHSVYIEYATDIKNNLEDRYSINPPKDLNQIITEFGSPKEVIEAYDLPKIIPIIPLVKWLIYLLFLAIPFIISYWFFDDLISNLVKNYFGNLELILSSKFYLVIFGLSFYIYIFCREWSSRLYEFDPRLQILNKIENLLYSLPVIVYVGVYIIVYFYLQPLIHYFWKSNYKNFIIKGLIINIIAFGIICLQSIYHIYLRKKNINSDTYQFYSSWIFSLIILPNLYLISNEYYFPLSSIIWVLVPFSLLVGVFTRNIKIKDSNLKILNSLKLILYTSSFSISLIFYQLNISSWLHEISYVDFNQTSGPIDLMVIIFSTLISILILTTLVFILRGRKNNIINYKKFITFRLAKLKPNSHKTYGFLLVILISLISINQLPITSYSSSLNYGGGFGAFFGVSFMKIPSKGTFDIIVSVPEVTQFNYTFKMIYGSPNISSPSSKTFLGSIWGYSSPNNDLKHILVFQFDFQKAGYIFSEFNISTYANFDQYFAIYYYFRPSSPYFSGWYYLTAILLILATFFITKEEE